MTSREFESILDRTAELFTHELRSSERYHGPEKFEQGALEMLKVAAADRGVRVSPTWHPHAFPDVKVNGFGVEVKFSRKDRWRTVGNSIFEGMRDPTVTEIYVLFGKIGGIPEVRWSRYEECIAHVRVSNSPRFVLDLSEDHETLFQELSVRYSDFARLSDDAKMKYVRSYATDRLGRGERLWWLEPSHTLPIQVRVYMNLPEDEKRVLRAEAAILSPKVCGGRHTKNKYTDAALYLLTYRGVFCPQARDLFSAGSVALRGDRSRGGKYIERALSDIEDLMLNATMTLDDALFVEYWGESCPEAKRIERWLELADGYATDWCPSERLFLQGDR